MPNLKGHLSKIIGNIPALDDLSNKANSMKKTKESLEKINEKLNDIADLTDFDFARENGKTIKTIYDIDSA